MDTTTLRELLGVLRDVGVFALPLLTAWAGRWLLAWYDRQPAQCRELLTAVLDSAIYATEQLSKTSLVRDKRALALRMADDQLRAHGLQADIAVLDTQLEARVWTLLNQARYAPSATPAPAPPRRRLP